MTNAEAREDILLTMQYLKNVGVFDNPANGKKCEEALVRGLYALNVLDKIQILIDMDTTGNKSIKLSELKGVIE